MASQRLIGQGLSGQPDLCSIQELAEGSSQDAAATQVSHGGEGEGGAEVIWRRGSIHGGHGLKVHLALVRRSPTGGGGWGAGWRGPLVLAELVLEHLDLISQLGELVVGRDRASSGDASLRDPAEEVEPPQGEVRGQEQGDEETLQVRRPGEPVPEEALRGAFHHLPDLGEVRLEPQHQGVSPRQRAVHRAVL